MIGLHKKGVVVGCLVFSLALLVILFTALSALGYIGTDTTPPVVTNVLPTGTITGSSTVVSASFSDPESGIKAASVAVYVDDSQLTTCTATQSSVSCPISGLAPGDHAILGSVANGAGLATEFNGSFTVGSGTSGGPVVSDVQPSGTISTTDATISASYSDSSGINIASVAVYLDGVQLTSCMATSTHVQCPVTGLATGSHVIGGSVANKAGISSPISGGFTVGSSGSGGPVVSSVLPTGSITTDSPVISAAYSDSTSGINTASVVVYLDGEQLTSCSATSANVQCPVSGLSTGDHYITGSVSNKAGVSSPITGSFTVGEGTSGGPVVSDVQPSGNIDTTSTTISASYSDSTSGIDTASVVVYLDNVPLTTCLATSTNVQCPVTSLSAGDHVITGSVSNKAGASSPINGGFTVGEGTSGGPVVSDVQPSGIISTADTTITASYSDSNSGISAASVMVYLDGVQLTSCSATATNVQCPVSGLSLGGHVISGSVSNKAGISSPISGGFTVATSDGGGPKVTNVQPSGTISVTSTIVSANYSDSVSGIDVASVAVYLDGVRLVTCSATSAGVNCPVTGLALGTHTIGGSVANKEGITSPIIGAFTVSWGGPTVLNVQPSGIIGVDTANISADYFDSKSGIDQASVAVYLDGEELQCSVFLDKVGCPVTGLTEGPHVISGTVSNNDGVASPISGTFIVDFGHPMIDSVSPVDGAIVGPDMPLIQVTWHDTAAVNVYTTTMMLDGSPVSGATVDQYGMSYQTSDLSPGDHTVTVSLKDVIGNTVEKTWTFTYSHQLSYYAPWYDSRPSAGMNGNWILISNQDTTQAVVDVYIGGKHMTDGAEKDGHYYINPGDRVTPLYPNVVDGPVKVVSIDGQELLVSQRVLYKDSFNEVMATRESDLDTDYRFTWYDTASPGMNGNWILIGNPDSTHTASVDVYIGNAPMGSYNIAPGDRVTPSYPGVINGPVRVTCTNCTGTQKIMASQRVIYGDSFSEVMGAAVHASATDAHGDSVPITGALDKEYYFTWYDAKSPGMSGNWILVGNDADQDVYAEISIGGEKMKNADAAASVYGDDQYKFRIKAHDRITPVFPNVIGGPVRVVCTSCTGDQNIISSERTLYNGASFEEIQGTSPRDMGSSGVFTWYDFSSPGMMGDWLLIGNQDSSTDAAMNVFVGSGGSALKMNGTVDTFTALKGGGSTTPIFQGVIGGPVRVSCTTCTDGQKLIISQRVIYKNSFNEVVGRPPRK